MSTSGSIDFSLTRDQIITTALQEIGACGEGETPSANAVTRASLKLNALIKHWHTQDIHLWTESEGTLFLVSGQNTYTLDQTGSTDIAGKDVVESELASDGITTTLVVEDATGMNALDNLTVVLDDGSLQHTTIASIANDTLTLNDSLTSAASEGNSVFVYTNKVLKPLHITEARIRTPDSVDRPIKLFGRNEFMRIPAKTTSNSNVIAMYYSSQRDNGKIYVWPTPDDSNYRIKFTYLRTIEDFDSSGNTADLPQEWLHALILNLAVTCAPSYGVNLKRDYPDLAANAAMALEELKAWDSEGSSMYIVPARDLSC